MPAADEFTIAGFNIENFANNDDAAAEGRAGDPPRAALARRHRPRRDRAASRPAGARRRRSMPTPRPAGRIPALRGTPDSRSARRHPAVGFLIKTSRVQITASRRSWRDRHVHQDPVNETSGTCTIVRRSSCGPTRCCRRRTPRPFIVVVNHLRSFIDIELVGGEGTRVRAKRTAQAESLARAAAGTADARIPACRSCRSATTTPISSATATRIRFRS